MLVKFIDKKIPYTGKELRSLYIYHHFDLQGNALAAFAGPCDVKLTEMVDQEDVKADAPIYSRMMLHFLGEFFGESLETTVLRQRLLMAIMLDALRAHAPGIKWERSGDDIFVGKRKASVSIATASPVSTVIHAGLNVESAGAPVPAFGLNDARISPKRLALDVLARAKEEMEGIALACCKVRGVQ